MTFPITPPPELVQQWAESWTVGAGRFNTVIATAAAQWGWEQRGTANEAELQQRADQELACLEWLVQEGYIGAPCRLRTARRPKPPSLKEQALEALNQMDEPLGVVTATGASIIRRALEALPND